MPVCPKGHDSTSDDYCDLCGTPIGAAPPPPLPSAPLATRPAVACPVCQGPLEGRFCERCGHDSLAVSTVEPPAPPAPSPDDTSHPADAGNPSRTWLVVATADRAYFDRIRALDGPDAASIDFPRYCPERRFHLHGEQVLIGRRSRARGIHPDIDLVGPPEDPAVSHMHALLIAQPDRGWAVVDLHSQNCTYVNANTDPIEAEVPAALTDGDYLNLGAWTRLTLRAREPGEQP